jgi:tetratricopeptide (TPR) repeat protein
MKSSPTPKNCGIVCAEPGSKKIDAPFQATPRVVAFSYLRKAPWLQMTLRTHSFRFRLALFAFAIAFFPLAHSRSDEPHWVRVSTDHFAVVTDGDDRRARDIAVRFEQMRWVFGQLLAKKRVAMPEPIDILAPRNDDEYFKVVPVHQGQPVVNPSFFVPGEDRIYFVMNLSKDESWQSISHDFAMIFLNYNYPQTQAWFDEGFAQYFASLRLDNKQGTIGGDPNSFVPLLSGATWLSIPDLFGTGPENVKAQDNARHNLFAAQSWIVMHYLLSQNKLPETGAYFDLVQNQQVPIDDAIQKAYGMSATQFGQAIKDYFHSLQVAPQTQENGHPPPAGNSAGVQALAAPPADQIGSSMEKLLETEGEALLWEMSVRLPEHREQAMRDLDAITNQPKGDNVIARRALAWAYMQKKDFNQAVEELSKGAELNSKDPWLHYYLALLRHAATQTGQEVPEALPNMMQDLRIVLNWDPEFAEARSMLAMAQLEGGGVHAAMDSMRIAIQLSPRNQSYLLNMAEIYMAGKEWEAATAMLERLKKSSDPQIAKSAREQLEGLPMLKKYGVMPQANAKTQSARTASASAPASPSQPMPSATQPSSAPRRKTLPPPQSAQPPQTDADAGDDHPDEPPAEPQPDKRPIKFVKGKLLSVDCSQSPSATLTVSSNGKALKLRTDDFKSLTLIGAENFSCEWSSRSVSVNYRAGGKADGDLVSLEVQ